MKNKILFCATMMMSSFVMAQNCPVSFPTSSTTLTYQADGTHLTSGDVVWICKGLTFEISGDNNQVFVEKNCTMTISGNNNTIYQKGPGQIDISGNNNDFTIETTVTPQDLGTGNSETDCDTLIVDYENAPDTASGGCFFYSGIDTPLKEHSVSFFPNPVKDNLMVNRIDVAGKQMLRFYNLSGQMVLFQNLNNQQNNVRVSSLKPGVYVLRIDTDSGYVTERITVQ